ncbi:MAG: hypothetical protein J7623_08565 [Chitinophaga sp.]|uniref:hypothetical protein n=1 Tax=Chitinophaga sp. TaxID=1869181 RepID=UPI001B0CA5B3|nr:hypothetical protein [Chitinophaga sp.]MBO9728675.1 hypothetical protein [Chitinophaga sp.]
MSDERKTDKEKLDEKAAAEQQKHHAGVKPDPETMGPEPQEKMTGPVSSVIRKIAEAGDEEDIPSGEQEKDAIDREDEEREKKKE